MNFKGNHNTLRAVGQFSNKTEVFSQFALEFQVCVRCAFEGNIARLSAAGNGTLRHHLLFSRRKACYLLLEGVWYDRVRYMNELFEKYSKVQERRIFTINWCASQECLSYTLNQMLCMAVKCMSFLKKYFLTWIGPLFSKFFQGPLIICYNLGSVYLFLRLLLAGLFRYRGCNNVVVSSLKTLSSGTWYSREGPILGIPKPNTTLGEKRTNSEMVLKAKFEEKLEA